MILLDEHLNELEITGVDYLSESGKFILKYKINKIFEINVLFNVI